MTVITNIKRIKICRYPFLVIQPMANILPSWYDQLSNDLDWREKHCLLQIPVYILFQSQFFEDIEGGTVLTVFIGHCLCNHTLRSRYLEFSSVNVHNQSLSYRDQLPTSISLRSGLLFATFQSVKIFPSLKLLYSKIGSRVCL